MRQGLTSGARETTFRAFGLFFLILASLLELRRIAYCQVMISVNTSSNPVSQKLVQASEPTKMSEMRQTFHTIPKWTLK